MRFWLMRTALCSGQVGQQADPAYQSSSYSYARGFRANWVSAHSNLERLATDSIGFSVLKMALI